MGTFLLGIESVFVPCEILLLGEWYLFDLVALTFASSVAKCSNLRMLLCIVGNGVHEID